MTNRLKFAAVALLAFLAVPSCGGSGGGSDAPPGDNDAPGETVRSALTFDETPGVDDATVHELTTGQLALASDLLALDPGAVNQALSPVSISVAFAMLSTGARGNTLAEVESALHFPPQETLHPAMNALLAALRDRDVPAGAENDGVLLRPVNQIFQERTFPVESAFLDMLALRYDAGVQLMDFEGAPDPSRLLINDWVLDQTNDRIVDLLPDGSIDSLTRLVLVNALYLKAAWNDAFPETATADGVFHAVAGDLTVPFMEGEVRTVARGAVGDAEVLELRFADETPGPALDDDPLVFTIVMPAAGASVDLVATVAGIDALSGGECQVRMPRFRVAMPLDLKTALQALGVHDLFLSEVCDLTGIQPAADLYVSGAFHQTFVDVNEKGVEAAAATAVVITDESMPPTVTIDRPFFFLVRDRATGAPLFVGHIGDPSASS